MPLLHSAAGHRRNAQSPSCPSLLTRGWSCRQHKQPTGPPAGPPNRQGTAGPHSSRRAAASAAACASRGSRGPPLRR
eukprot:10284156-Lingulodinium_polyedra.AAC.1